MLIKRFNLKSFLAGFLVCAVLSGTLMTYADDIYKNIDVVMNGIKVTLNGQEVKSDTEPFIYSDRTYLPVKSIADALGLKTVWNETTNTVEITSAVQPQNTPAPSQEQDIVVRNVKWGMSKDEVLASENDAPITNENDSVTYDITAFNIKSKIIYKFDSDMKLSQINIASDSTHSDYYDYIADYESWRKELFLKYGQYIPAYDMSWKDNIYRDQPSYYGLAVATGHLSYISCWKHNNTDIICMLKGENKIFSLNIIYKRSK